MRNSVSISLPDTVLRQLKGESKRENAHFSEIVRRALGEYFFKMEFSRLRRKAIIEAARRRIHPSEEEIFKTIS